MGSRARSGLIGWIGAILVACAAFGGCKTGGPVTPYDKPRPAVEGDLIVQAFDKGLAVSGATVEVLEPTGDTQTASTDAQGQALFNFKYDLFQLKDLPPFSITFPTQGIYYASRILHAPEKGQNIVTFWSKDNRLEAVPQNGVSYSYNLQNDLVFDLRYERPGNLAVPVSLAVQNLPSGWVVNYEKETIGDASFDSAATITVPAFSYKQPTLTFDGFRFDGENYVFSSPCTIYRGFPINVWSSASWTASFVSVNTWNISGYWGFATGNAANVPWSCYARIGIYGVDGQYYYSASSSFTGNSGSQPWSLVNYNCGSHNCTGEVQIEMYAHNPDVGTYYILYRTGTIILGGGSFTLPTQSF